VQFFVLLQDSLHSFKREVSGMFQKEFLQFAFFFCCRTTSVEWSMEATA